MGTVFIAAAGYDSPPQPTPTGERQHDSPSAILSQTSIETTLNHVPAPPHHSRNRPLPRRTNHPRRRSNPPLLRKHAHQPQALQL